MKSAFFSKVSIVLIIAAILSLLIIFSPVVSYEAHAEDVNIGTWTVYLTYGEVPSVAPVERGGSYYCIQTFSAKIDGSTMSSLVDEKTHAVNAIPKKEGYEASASLVVSSCDAEGTTIADGKTYVGKVLFIVSGTALEVELEDKDLTKTYGETATLSWTKGAVTVTFSSEGLAATARAGEYDIALDSVKNGEEDATEYYDVTVKNKEGGEPKFTVTPLAVTLSFAEEQTVAFNGHFSDGRCVATAQSAGANGETVVGSFRLVEEYRMDAYNVLTIDDRYEMELYEVRVKNSSGEWLEEGADSYIVTADLAENGKVRAVVGAVTLYQDADKMASRQGDDSYVYIDPARFLTYTYLDAFVADYAGEFVFEDVEIYAGVSVTLTCTAEIDAGVIDCGTYPLTLKSFEGSAFTDITIEDLALTVTPLVLSYDEVAEIQYGMSPYETTVTKSHGGKDYTFDIVCDTDGVAVGNTAKYTESTVASKEDSNVLLSFEDGAGVLIIKRTDGVAFEAADDLTGVLFAADYTVCNLNYTDEEGNKTPIPVRYAYQKAGKDVWTEEAPFAVGSYKIKASVDSDSYDAADVIYDLTIVKRPVLVVYNILTAEKTYGETFEFTTKNVQLDEIYAYDKTEKTADRSRGFKSVSADVMSDADGMGIYTDGAAPSAIVGSYAFTYKLTSSCYEVASLEIRLKNTGAVVTEFTVKKALKPPQTSLTLEYSGRTVTVRSGIKGFEAELSAKSDFTSPETASSVVTQNVNFSDRKYGQTYYVRIRLKDGTNYANQYGDWSEVKHIAIPFPAPTVKESSVTDTEATFTADTIKNAVSYTWQHKVGDGEWTDGLKITGLAPETTYSVSFRAKAGGVAGESKTVSLKTLRAAVKKEEVAVTYDRMAMTLNVASQLTLEMRLLKKTDDGWEEVVDWTDERVFEEVERDGEYVLQVRNVRSDAVSAITEIEFNTYKEKEPFTLEGFVSDWFLIIVGAVVLIAFTIATVSFAKLKSRTDKKAMGGKNGK